MPLQFPPWDILATISVFSETQLTLTAVPIQVAAADPKRWLLVFTGVPTASASVSTSSSMIGGQGLPVNSSPPFPVVMDLDTWGPFVTQAWYGRGVSVGSSLTVLTASVIEWPTGLTPGVELPYRRADRRDARRQAAADGRAAKVLRDLLARYNVVAPEWLAEGAQNNGD